MFFLLLNFQTYLRIEKLYKKIFLTKPAFFCKKKNSHHHI